MEYSGQTELYKAKYNLSFNDVVFAYLLAAGMDQADAHRAAFPSKAPTTRQREEATAAELIRANPSIQLLIQEIKRKAFKARQAPAATQAQEISEEEREKFTTRKGLINELIKNSLTLTGKELGNSLQTLAKIQGFDKPDDGENEEERRRFVLRWLSKCRTCKLMRLYMEIRQAEGL